MLKDGNDTGKPRNNDQWNRPICSEAKCTRDIRSLNEGYQSLTVCKPNIYPDNSYQPLVTGPSGANVSEDGLDTGHPRDTDPLIGQIDFIPINPSEVLYMNNELKFTSIDPVDRPWTTGQLVSQRLFRSPTTDSRPEGVRRE